MSARLEHANLGVRDLDEMMRFLLETALERGSTFTSYFPQVAAVEDPIVAAPSFEEPVGGTETILLVEDDGPLRALLGSRLRDLGYTVLSACDGPEALEL